MKRAVVLLLAAILPVAFAVWWFSPTQTLKRRALAFIASADVPESMTDLARTARGRNIAPYLAPRIEIDGPAPVDRYVPNSILRDQAATLYTAAARAATMISLENPEIQSIEVEDDLATIRLRLDAIVEFNRRRPADGIQNLTLRWRRIDQAWQITHASWTESPR